MIIVAITTVHLQLLTSMVDPGHKIHSRGRLETLDNTETAWHCRAMRCILILILCFATTLILSIYNAWAMVPGVVFSVAISLIMLLKERSPVDATSKRLDDLETTVSNITMAINITR